MKCKYTTDPVLIHALNFPEGYNGIIRSWHTGRSSHMMMMKDIRIYREGSSIRDFKSRSALWALSHPPFIDGRDCYIELQGRRDT